ncbi:helix-turn-helix domain-containing protein [Clostridium ganghwense]|uniref:Helix-turn-helix domain-containing protein n=1 Tax=Clostridium ganghwense TaxID=312089 RepID=A0ABT4CUL3_9CLOT|nr:helix-turn-helix domain-containing protein [Clostridium ganghwense]MCY6372765.1 helix-turn-helix domain-containing protein [Clostridium ganghwense]
MPFKKVSIKEEVEKRIEKSEEFKKAYLQVEEEFELIKQAIKMRKEMGKSQTEVAEEAGMSQQMVSRIEKVGNSPTLRNFLRYLDGMDLQIKIEKKSINERECAV